eukprot:gene31194-22656_t
MTQTENSHTAPLGYIPHHDDGPGINNAHTAAAGPDHIASTTGTHAARSAHPGTGTGAAKKGAAKGAAVLEGGEEGRGRARGRRRPRLRLIDADADASEHRH